MQKRLRDAAAALSARWEHLPIKTQQDFARSVLVVASERDAKWGVATAAQKLKRLRDRARRAFLNSDIASFWAGSSPCLLDKRPAALDGWMKLDTICFSVIFPALRTMNASVGASTISARNYPSSELDPAALRHIHDAKVTLVNRDSRGKACGGCIFRSSCRDVFPAALCRSRSSSLEVDFRWYERLRLHGPRGASFGPHVSKRAGNSARERPWLNKFALFADVSCGRSTARLGRRWNCKGRTIGLREPQRGSLIPPIEGQMRVGHQHVGSEPRRLLPCKDRGDNIRSEKGQPHKARRIRSR